MYMSKDKFRILVGVLIVAAIFVFIGFSSYVQRQGEFDNLISSASKYSSDVPTDFNWEVLDVASVGGFDIKVSDNQKIVGFSLPFSAENSFDLIKNKLTDNNWKCVDSGNKLNSTFVKEEGNYKWLFLNCVAIGGVCSVVFTSD